MTYCTKCGTPQESGSRFCTNCGKEVIPPSTSPATAPHEALSSTTAGWHDWETHTPISPRSRSTLAAALTTLVLLLGGTGVTTWLILVHDTATPTLPAPPLTPPPSQSQAEVFTSHAVDPPSGIGSEETALNQLTQQIALDWPQVRSQLAETWVPQLSSKQPGLVVDDISYGYTDILNDHLALRATYSARLVWSDDWSSFREGDFYITVAAVSFSTPGEANAWCDRQAIDSDNCFAKRLSTMAGPDGSTVNR